ncbi:TraM recognition domain-containing protein [Dyadobacter luteus]|uniref:TraM recognition domain-containing protein n=1 Tax=Dyadobacter luteus TaxID=2259619 RepID=UPI0018F5D4E3|nr:TraM recognition domain-containing protein [Dyadobacter luteus]
MQIYRAVLSLYVNRLVKPMNQKDKLKISSVFGQVAIIYLNNMDSLISTVRSNKVATTLGIQDFSQLKKIMGAGMPM